MKVTFNPNEVLKDTALLYLKEALLAQQFEECAGLIRQAKSFGADQAEINALLAEYKRVYQADFDLEALKFNKKPRF